MERRRSARVTQPTPASRCCTNEYARRVINLHATVDGDGIVKTDRCVVIVLDGDGSMETRSNA